MYEGNQLKEVKIVASEEKENSTEKEMLLFLTNLEKENQATEEPKSAHIYVASLFGIYYVPDSRAILHGVEVGGPKIQTTQVLCSRIPCQCITLWTPKDREAPLCPGTIGYLINY